MFYVVWVRVRALWNGAGDLGLGCGCPQWQNLGRNLAAREEFTRYWSICKHTQVSGGSL